MRQVQVKLMVEFITIFSYLVRGDYKYCKMISDMLCLNQKLAYANLRWYTHHSSVLLKRVDLNILINALKMR